MEVVSDKNGICHLLDSACDVSLTSQVWAKQDKGQHQKKHIPYLWD